MRPCAECAVKTIVARGKTFNERLAAFETEAKVSWLASQTARKVSSPQRFLLLLLVLLSLSPVPRHRTTKKALDPERLLVRYGSVFGEADRSVLSASLNHTP